MYVYFQHRFPHKSFTPNPRSFPYSFCCLFQPSTWLRIVFETRDNIFHNGQTHFNEDKKIPVTLSIQFSIHSALKRFNYTQKGVNLNLQNPKSLIAFTMHGLFIFPSIERVVKLNVPLANTVAAIPASSYPATSNIYRLPTIHFHFILCIMKMPFCLLCNIPFTFQNACDVCTIVRRNESEVIKLVAFFF